MEEDLARFNVADAVVVGTGERTCLLVGCGPHTNAAGVSRLLHRLGKRAAGLKMKTNPARGVGDAALAGFVASLPPAAELPLRRVAVVRDLFDRDEVERPYLSSILLLKKAPSTSGGAEEEAEGEGAYVMARSVAGRDSLRRRLVNEYVLGARPEYGLVRASVELKEYLEQCLYVNVHLVDDGELANKQASYQISALVAKGKEADAETDTNAGRVWDTCRETVPSRTTGTILMVAPIGFQLNEETAQDNHFMHKPQEESMKIERKALVEFSNLHRALMAAGVKIVLHAAERYHRTPDAVFPNNWFSTHSAAESGVPTLAFYPMKTPSRRAERRQSIVAELQEIYQRELTFEHWENADPPRFLESTGVLILDRVRKLAYAALSQRCSRRVASQWANRMGYDMCFFRAIDARNQPIYHTNVMMCVGSSVAVVCLDSVADPMERANLERTLSVSHAIVEISREQVDEFCGNCLEVKGTDGKRVLAMSSRAFSAFTNSQREALLRHVDEIVHVPIDTIETVGGGGVRCMMAELF